MILSDDEIRTAIEGRWIGYAPYDEGYVNPASIDMTLSGDLLLSNHADGSVFRHRVLDVAEIEPDHTEHFVMDENGYVLRPGQFLLACTQEVVDLPDDIVGRVEGKSSLGRLGLAVHITAGFIDPGFCGHLTLEVANLAPWSVRLRPGMRIAQLAFTRMSSPAVEPYGVVGHYQNQPRLPVESRFKMGAVAVTA